jgi:hypothetical protein
MMWAALNLVFFSSVLVSAMFPQFSPLEPAARLADFPAPFPLNLELPLLVAYVFVFNVFISAFLVVTLPGLGFFALPAFFLVLRAYFWGLSLSQLSTSVFWAALPTVIIEGEAYVVAAVAGTMLGLSWLKPSRSHEGKMASRLVALKRAVRECAYLYVLAAILLAAAAVIEAIAIQQIQSG